MTMTLPANFTHLQVHSHYTLLGGIASIADLVARAAGDGLKYLALTDTNALYGVVAFTRACRAAQIQPVVGMSVNVTAPPGEISLDDSPPGRLVLLATGPVGYQSLCRLSSLVQTSTEREVLRQRGISWETLKAHRQGIICLEGGALGWLFRCLRDGNSQAAVRYVSRLGGIYQESCYLGLTLGAARTTDGQPSIEAVAREVEVLGQRFGMPAVALQPVFCLEPGDAPLLRLLAAIDNNCALAAVPSTQLPSQGEEIPLHWHNPDEMAGRFAAFPQALARVGDVVKRCQPALPGARPIWPNLKLPARQSPEMALTRLAQAGLKEKYGRRADAGIRERLQRELDAIAHHGCAALCLVVADIVRFARETDVPVSTRGSVANSLVAFCLGITTVDPIAHDLVFERFLNPARATLPDIDLDFCSRRRDEVLNYVRRTYGEDRVALVATISTMRPKSAVRETAKAYGLDETTIKELTTLLPRDWHPDPRRRQAFHLDDLLVQIDDERAREVVRLAYRIRGQPHHLSIHPGGIVITPDPLTDFVPVQLAPKGFLITQFDYRDLETVGLPKIDLLGIRALTVLADTADLVRACHDSGFRLEHIPLEDARTGELLARGQAIGVFQCESAGAQRTLRQLQVRTVADLAIANAFFKPGPAMGGMARAFIRRYRGEEPVSYLHPALKPILSQTQGVLLFQEQVLRIATEIAGLSWAQADHLRYGMSKFKAREMAALRLNFVLGCQEVSQFSQEQAETLWEQVIAFAGYGFNQGHALAYADVSYRSAYLKAHWPAEFLCARLADAGGFHHPAIYIAEAQQLGIPVRPPHVNASGRKFTLTREENRDRRSEIEDNQSPISDLQSPILWMGLGQVRDLRQESIRAIVAVREERPFTGLRDLLARVPLQTKEALHLIQCGAMDGLGESRAALLAEAESISRAGSAHQMAFAFATETAVPPETAAQRLEWERAILGQSVSVHPLDLVQRPKNAVSLRQLASQPTNQLVTTIGARLPGWTGGQGFFFGDGDTFVVVKLGKGTSARDKLRPWRPMCLAGQWHRDEWGGGWFEVANLQVL
ncbi:MAG TPA: DNA polymerase III subunit alpha [Anaerolineae bacterium]